MAEDKQLTVAELLARARQQDPEAAERPRRRRRRSLEDGGITVAELTGSFKAVDAAPPEAKHAVPIDEEEPVGTGSSTRFVREPERSAPSPSDDDTGIIEKITTPEREPVVEPKSVANAETSILPSIRDEDLEAEHQHDPYFEEEDFAPRTELEPVAEEEEESSGSGFGTVALMSLGGIIAGVLIFLAFQLVWQNLSGWIAAILAVIVTVAIVYGVRALRTASDGLSMTLAGLVGIVVTFGPAALVYL